LTDADVVEKVTFLQRSYRTFVISYFQALQLCIVYAYLSQEMCLRIQIIKGKSTIAQPWILPMYAEKIWPIHQ